MLQRFEIANVSMAPALVPGDYVVAVKRRGAPRRGVVIVYQHLENLGFTFVKRVIGLPGETIHVDGGVVRVNGDVLEEPWASGTTPGSGTWHLGPSEMFVMGDQRDRSDGDSRQIGPIEATPRYEVICRYWPANRIGRITGTGNL